jgi:glycosyltransferase involved in cell wall biosynthesis
MTKKKLKILCAPANEGGCSYYRIIGPMKKLNELYGDQVEFRYNLNPLGMVTKENTENGEETVSGIWLKDWDFADMKWADIIWTNNISNFGGPYTARLVGKAKEFGKFVHFDTDDLLTDLYEGHRLYSVYKDRGLKEITEFIYANADLVTVTQRKFAERVKENVNGVLAIVKNAIDYDLPCWNMPPYPKTHKKVMRVGWAGGIHHEEDVKEFAGVPHLVNGRVGRERVHWGFYGSPLPPKKEDGGKDEWQHEVWRNYKRILLSGFKGQANWQIYHALPPDSYGGIYANMDLAIAPLQMNEFNDSKSEIKVAEAGRYKIPLIASDVGCYDETIVNGKTGYLLPAGASKGDWVKVLTKCLKNPKHVKEMGENLHKITEEYFSLGKVCKHRLELYEESIKLIKSRGRPEPVTYNQEWTFE